MVSVGGAGGAQPFPEVVGVGEIQLAAQAHERALTVPTRGDLQWKHGVVPPPFRVLSPEPRRKLSIWQLSRTVPALPSGTGPPERSIEVFPGAPGRTGRKGCA
ncbi:hypothetical protein GCM10009678_35670 [Actinomadura kijaniata]